MSRREIASEDEISTHPHGKLLAIPAKGQRGRKLAFASCGILVSGAFATLTVTSLQDSPPPPAERESKGHGAKEGDAFQDTPKPGYYPTYLDGGGGIAGVPLTAEQRRALIREAWRRGLSIEDAYALAYGDNAKIHVHPDGTVHVFTDGVVVPNRPVYAKAPPGMAVYSSPAPSA
jgi:hypothetical protein